MDGKRQSSIALVLGALSFVWQALALAIAVWGKGGDTTAGGVVLLSPLCALAVGVLALLISSKGGWIYL